MRIEQLTDPVTATGGGPVLLSEMKEHLRVDHSSSDAEINIMIDAAALMIENYINMHLLERQVAIWMDGWPQRDSWQTDAWWDGVQQGAIRGLHQERERLELPVRPLKSIDAIEVYDQAGTASIWSAEYYYAQPGVDPFIVRLVPNWPQSTRPADGIRIMVTSGYGASPDDIPADLKQALKLLVGHFWAHRGDDMGVGLPKTVKALLRPYRRVQL